MGGDKKSAGPEEIVGPKEVLGCGKELESRTRVTLNDHSLQEHRRGSDPQAIVAVECAIDDIFLFRFRVPSHPYHLIVLAFIVSIATRLHHRVSFLSLRNPYYNDNE
jgi:hypothetical protein